MRPKPAAPPDLTLVGARGGSLTTLGWLGGLTRQLRFARCGWRRFQEPDHQGRRKGWTRAEECTFDFTDDCGCSITHAPSLAIDAIRRSPARWCWLVQCSFRRTRPPWDELQEEFMRAAVTVCYTRATGAASSRGRPPGYGGRPCIEAPTTAVARPAGRQAPTVSSPTPRGRPRARR